MFIIVVARTHATIRLSDVMRVLAIEVAMVLGGLVEQMTRRGMSSPRMVQQLFLLPAFLLSLLAHIVISAWSVVSHMRPVLTIAATINKILSGTMVKCSTGHRRHRQT